MYSVLSLYRILHTVLTCGKGGNAMEKGALVTAEMLAPITTTLNSNLGVLLPVGIAIMGVMIGVSLIPRIVYKFL